VKTPKHLLVSALLALIVAFAAAPGAFAATAPKAKTPVSGTSTAKPKPATDAWPLHHGKTFKLSSRGPRVAMLQFLIRNPRPKANVFKAITGTLKPHTFTKGIYDRPTALAVIKYKFAIGVPGKGQCTTGPEKMRGPSGIRWDNAAVGPYFIQILEGKKNRAPCWIALAAKRRAEVASGVTPLAAKLVAFEKSQLGVAEPYAYTKYNGYFHLPIEAWCAIFANYSLVHIGLPRLGAYNPWYVPSIIDWGRHGGSGVYRGSYLTGVAKVGEFALYYGDISHIGLVVSVSKDGSYRTIDGNWGNRVAGPNYRGHSYPLHYFLALSPLLRR